jgi:hypothetical protein
VKKIKIASILWAAYLLALMLMSGATYASIPDLYGRLERHEWHNDFVTFYAAGAFASGQQGGKGNVYDHKEFTTQVLKYMPAPKEPIDFFMAYPPYFLPVMSLFSLLSLGDSWLLWNLLSVASICLSVLILTRGHFNRCQQAAILIIVNSSSPAWVNFIGGQTSGFLLLAVTAVWLLLKNSRMFQAGIATAVVAFKLQFLPLVALGGFCLGKIRYASGLAIAVAILSALAFAALGWDNIVQFPQSLFGNEGNELHRKFNIEANCRTVLGMIPGITPDNATPVAALFFVAAAAICILVWLKVYPSLRNKTDFAFEICASATTILAVAFSIHANIYDYLLLSTPFIWLWRFAASFRDRKIQALILLFPIATQPVFCITILGAHGWSMPFFFATAFLLRLVQQVRLLIKEPNRPNVSNTIPGDGVAEVP